MARFYPLFSSSSGNCSYIGDENGGVLIDAGVSCKRITCALEANGIPPEAVRAVFVTHTHSDHIAGLKVFVKKYGCAVFAQDANIRELVDTDKLAPSAQAIPLEKGSTAVGDVFVEHFVTSHDCAASCGFVISYSDGKRAAVCTDLGIVTDTVRDALTGVDMILLESNYDEQMLRSGPYPYPLQQRIRSEVGHLSNTDSAALLRYLFDRGTRRFVLGHLSRHNNRPELALAAAYDALEGFENVRDYRLEAAAPENPRKAVIF